MKQACTIEAKPRSFPPIETTIIFTRVSRAAVSSWSAWGGSPCAGVPPLEARMTFVVTAPEHARLMRRSTGSRAERTSATSERWQPLAAVPSM